MTRVVSKFFALLTVMQPVAAVAADCEEALAELKVKLSAQDPAVVLAAAQAFRNTRQCNATTQRMALSQAAGVIANHAQNLMNAGESDTAMALLLDAPALHWAIPTLRADAAARAGNRPEAAQLYATALDVITDPALTPNNPQLAPVVDRLTRLAQENTMLAGTLRGSITRGDQPSGVLRTALRGIAIEPLATAAHSANVRPASSEQSTSRAEPVSQTYEVEHAAVQAAKVVFLPIRFAFGSAELDASGQVEVRRLAHYLNANGISHLTLVGHTDEIGTDALNLDLSRERARNVRHFLLQEGVDAEIDVDGRGEREPPQLVDPLLYNDEERRAIARRVELLMHG